MDEEDSQDELVIRAVSHGKGKRPVSSIFTDEEDDSDNGADNSEESDNSRENEDDEEEEGDEEGTAKGLGGAVGGTSANLTDASSDDDAEKCPICLHSFQEQLVATPEGCEHYFCLDCILEWSKNANSCPVDRIVFSHIYLRKCYGGKVRKTITVQKPVKAEEEEVDVDFDQTCCEVCGRSDREDRLLLCDGCDAGYHMECLTPPLDAVPVEEWFCPECASNNPNTGDSAEEVSEDEMAALLADAVPTTSRLRTTTAGMTRSIARTRQSERVRANVNRNRITQARTIQHVPRYLIQSTWLDETINAVLNSAAYRAGTSRKQKTGSVEKQRKTKNKKMRTRSCSTTSSKDRTAGQEVKSHRQHPRRAKSEQKLVAKKDPTPRSRFPKSLGAGKQKQSSSTPSTYQSDIGHTSLSIYGDPFDLDPFDDDNRTGGQGSGPLSSLDGNRRGLSHSALRSHQPVARPVQVDLSRRGLAIPDADMAVATAPVPDLLGSILSGQSMLLMDSSDVVINRDGSLKPVKPASVSSSKTSISSSSSIYELTTEIHLGVSTSSGSNEIHAAGDAGPSHSLPNRVSSSHSPTSTSSSPAAPISPQAASYAPHMPSAEPRDSRVSLLNPVLQRPSGNRMGLSQRGWGTHSPSNGPTPLRHTNSSSDSGSRGKEMGLVKRPPPKPVWQDVSGLPRIPKVRRESHSGFSGGCGKSSDGTSDSCLNNLMGNSGQEQTMNQGLSRSEQGRAWIGERPGQDRAGTLSTFFSSLSTSTCLTASATSSSIVSFHIHASGNTNAKQHTSPWGLSNPLPSTVDESLGRNPESKQMHLSSQSHDKHKPVKGEIYDPFNPTHSDSDASASESEAADTSTNDLMSKEKQATSNLVCNQVDVGHPAKPETLEDNSKDRCTGASEDFKKITDFTYASVNFGGDMQNPCKSEELNKEPLLLEEQATLASDGTNLASVDCEQSNGQNGCPQNEDFSHQSRKTVQSEDKFEPSDRRSRSMSRSPSHSSAWRKQDLTERLKMKDGASFSSSSDTNGRDRKAEGKSSEKRLHRSRSRERKRTRSPSTLSEASERSRRRRRRQSRSHSRDRRRCHSRSREQSKSRRPKEKSHERYRNKRRESWKGSKDKRQDYSHSHSRSRSRERRRDYMWSQSTFRPRDRFRSRSKDRKKLRSRSRSKERSENYRSHSSLKTKSPSETPQKQVPEPKEKKQKPVSPSIVEDVEPKEVKEDKAVSLGLVKGVTEPKETKKCKPASSSVVEEFTEPAEFIQDKPVSGSIVKEVTEPKEIREDKPVSLGLVKNGTEFKVKKDKLVSPSTAKDVPEPKEINKDKFASASTVKEGTESEECIKNKPVFPDIIKEVPEPKQIKKDTFSSSGTIKQGTESEEFIKDKPVSQNIIKEVSEPKDIKDKFSSSSTIKEVPEPKELVKDKPVSPSIVKEVEKPKEVKEDKPISSSAVKEVTEAKEGKIQKPISPTVNKEVKNPAGFIKIKVVSPCEVKDITDHKPISPSMLKEITEPKEKQKDKVTEHQKVKKDKRVTANVVKGAETKEKNKDIPLPPDMVKVITKPKEDGIKKHLSSSVIKEPLDPKKIRKDRNIYTNMAKEVTKTEEMKEDKSIYSNAVKEVTESKEVKIKKPVSPIVDNEAKEPAKCIEHKLVSSSKVKKVTGPKEITVKKHVSLDMFKDVTKDREFKMSKFVSSSAVEEATEPNKIKIKKRIPPTVVKEDPREFKIDKNVSPTLVKEVRETREFIKDKTDSSTGPKSKESKETTRKHVSPSVGKEENNPMKTKTEKSTSLIIVKEEVTAAVAHKGEVKNVERKKGKKRAETKPDFILVNNIKPQQPAQSCQDKLLSTVKTKTSAATLSSGMEKCLKVETGSTSPNSLLVVKEEKMETTPPKEKDPVKQGKEMFAAEPSEISLDSDLSRVDVQKPDEVTVAGGDEGSAEVQNTPVVKEKGQQAVTPDTEPVTVTACSRSKPLVKRVTWNLKDLDGPPTEKPGKLCKLKQSSADGLNTPASSSQALTQPAAVLSECAGLTEKGNMAASLCGSEDLELGVSAAGTGQGVQDPSVRDEYMKKLELQERAVEEVKLAMKPFYQKKDITKEEYKEILRKAVQKICHSRSGEISAVRVANLVKAYVEKYKHTRRHRSEGEEGPSQGAERTRDPVVP